MLLPVRIHQVTDPFARTKEAPTSVAPTRHDRWRRAVRVTLARAVAVAGLVGGAVACSDGTSAPVVQTFLLQVQVNYPASYGTAGATGARVILASTERGSADTVTATAGGLATFVNVIPGTYTVSASRSLTPGEAEQLTGVAEALTLNALLPATSFLAPPTSLPTLTLGGSRLGDLVIKEVYYTGSLTPSGGTYFSDQFTELYNNSTDTIYLDGLLIADVFGVSGQINPTNVPTPFQSDANNVYVSSIWQIPGTGQQRPLAPGRSVVIAQDGINHRTDPNGNPNSPVDLADADWETYNERPDGRDLDSPTVPNLTRIVHRGGFDWLLTVFGPGVVIFRTNNVAALDTVLVPGTTATYRTRVPNSAVIDAFEALQNGNSGAYKRIPASLDAGFVFASGTYTSQSARRKTARFVGTRRVLQDTNNSTDDFIITAPGPRRFD
jgi:hypothetical protein